MLMKIKKNYAIWQILTLGAFFLLFFNYLYGDLLITTIHGINFWDCLFSGNIRGYYAYNLNAELVAGDYNGYYGAYYDFIIYIIFAIWNLPLWIIKKLFSVPHILNNIFSMLWAKSIILPFLAVSLYYFYKICLLIQDDEKHIAETIFLFLTSSFTVAYLVVIGQYDIITISLMLMGMYFYMINRNDLFLFVFSIAIPVKAFALFLYLILLLYRFKNIWELLLRLMCALIPFALLRVVIPFAGNNNISSFIPLLFNNMWTASFGTMSLFIMCFMLLIILAYCLKPAEDNRKRNIESVYLSFLTYAVFLSTTSPLPYWFMYLTPFMFLIIAGSKKKMTVNMMLEMFCSFVVVIAQVFTFYWCYCSASSVLLKAIHPKSGQTTFGEVVETVIGTEIYSQYSGLIIPVCMAIYIASILSFGIVNNPWKQINMERLLCDSQVDTALNIIRIFLALIICGIPVVCYCAL